MAVNVGLGEHPADEVFIVGSGFSRAAWGPMPTLLGLGDALRLRLLASPRYMAMLGDRIRSVLEQGQIPSGDVETWLSSLAERQPFMSQSQGSVNLGLFQEISEQLVDLVSEAQQGFWEGGPSWLHRLLRLWHRRRVVVVTFNYDTIVEESMVNLDAPHDPGDVVAGMLRHIPRPAVGNSWYGGATPVPTFTLLKLHGSLDWYWNPDDSSGDTLCRRTPGALQVDERPALAGKVPFIVPPLSAKSPFYSLGIVRQLWRDAAEALQGAGRIVVLGYSVPLTDLATTSMLSQVANPDARWDVANIDAARVSGRLADLGIPPTAVEVHGSIADWVDAYEAHHCRLMTGDLIGQLNEAGTGAIMPKRSRSDVVGLVHTIHQEGGKLVLEARERDLQSVIPEECPRETHLVDALRNVDPPGQVIVRFDGVDGDHRVLGALDPGTAFGTSGVANWCAIEIQDASSGR